MPLTEHKEPWFMRLNLGEEVPVFIHGDTIVSDYNQIIDYIETNFIGGMTTERYLACYCTSWYDYNFFKKKKYIYIYTHTHTHTHTYTCIYVYIYIHCMYVCMYVYIQYLTEVSTPLTFL